MTKKLSDNIVYHAVQPGTVEDYSHRKHEDEIDEDSPTAPLQGDDYKRKAIEMLGAKGSLTITLPKTNKKALLKQTLLSISVSLGYFCIGMVRGYSAPAMPSIREYDPELLPTEGIVAWVSSIPPFGAFFGSIIAAPLMHQVGRRKTLLLASPIWIISWILVASAKHWEQMLAARWIMGFCAGLALPASQIYVAECCDPEIRGVIGSFPSLGMSMGILVTYIMGTYMRWDTLAYACALISTLLFLFVIFMPESPAWLKTKNRLGEAQKSIDWLHLSGITATPSTGPPQKDKLISYKALFSRACLMPLGIGLGLLAIQQVSGIDAVIFFTVEIFRAAGSSLNSYMCTIIVGAVQLMSNFASLFVVDKAGRKPLLIISAVTMCLSMASMGAAFHLNEIGDHRFGFLPLLSLIVFMIGFSFGFGTIPFLLMGELFPAQQRSFLSSIAGSVNLLIMFIVIVTYHPLEHAITAAGTFWMYSIFCAIGVFFVIFLVPETKGKELESIASLFVRKLSARFSRKGSTCSTVRKSEEGITPEKLNNKK